MDPVVFPFLSLPLKSQFNVLKTMGLLEIVSFSFCSKRTKYLVVPLKLTAYSVEIYIGRLICVPVSVNDDFFVFGFYIGSDVAVAKELVPLPLPHTVAVRHHPRSTEQHVMLTLSNPVYEMGDWMEHLLTVFNHPKIDILRFERNCDRFDVNSIADALREYTIVESGFARTEGRAAIAVQHAVAAFQNTSKACIVGNLFDEPRAMQKVLMRNYDHLCAHFPISISDVLIINSSCITIVECHWPEQAINRLLKLWVRGSNSRLQRLMLKCPTEMDEGMILKSIRFTRKPDNVEREFRPFRSTSDQDREIVRGGCDIMRCDGTLATIVVINRGEFCLIDVFVWIK